MSHPPDGCREKIKRANEHIGNLNTEVTNFCAPYAHEIFGDKDRETGDYIFNAPVMPEPLPRFAVLAGEVIHQLRSSLDHLMWALARPRDPETRDVNFPICWRAEQFEEAFKRPIIKALRRSIRDKLESVQPHRASAGFAEEDALTILHRLNITDKHKLLLVVSSGMAVAEPIILHSYEGYQADDIEIIPKPPFSRLLRADQKNREIMRVKISPRFKMKPSVSVHFAPQIALDIPWLDKAEPIIPCLSQLRDAAEKVVSLFASEF